MQITLSEKNYLLSQIASVLSDLQSLVSILNSVKCQDEEDEEESDVSSISWDYDHDFPIYSTTPSHFYSLMFPESSDEEKESCQTDQNQTKSVNEENSFVNKISNFISSSFPNYVYNEEKCAQIRQVQLNAAVCEDLHCMWNNVGDLFIQKPEDSIPINTTANPAPEIK